MWLLRMPILEAFGLKAAARDLAAQYLGITILGMPTLFAMLTMNGAFRGMGDTVRPFYVTLGANLVHAALNWLLIFGNWGFPKMGLPGGATALAISQAVSTLLYVLFLRQSQLSGVRFFSPMDWEWTKRIAKIGLPAAGQQIVRVGSMLMLQILIARIGGGDAAVAALGVGLVSESIAFMPGFGYSIAASAFVGQNLGANQPKRANAGAWAATWQALLIMSLMGILFWVFAEPFARFFIPHLDGESATRAAQVEATVALTASYLRAAAWSEPFMALGMVLTGALQGAGATVPPTLITIVTMLFLRVPLAYFLMTSGYGTEGAWWAMSISTMVQGVATALLFRQGKWQKKKV
jgi:putative MATE family efflux protein